jgi:hypothetical protein
MIIYIFVSRLFSQLDRINASGIVHTFYRSNRYLHHRWRIESIRVVGNSVIGLFSVDHVLGFALERNLKVVKGCLSYNTLTSVINESLDTFNVLRINNSCNVVAISGKWFYFMGELARKFRGKKMGRRKISVQLYSPTFCACICCCFCCTIACRHKASQSTVDMIKS